MTSRLKTHLHLLGSALAIAGVVFVCIRMGEHWAQIRFIALDTTLALSVFGLALLYVLANLLVVQVWRDLLRYFGTEVSYNWALRTYGISQLAKYVPGNIFHLAGRQAMGAADGLAAWPLAKSIVWELGLSAATGTLFAGLVLPMLGFDMDAAWGVMLFPALATIVFWVLRYVPGPAVARAFGFQLAFLAVAGTLFLALLAALAEQPVAGWMMPAIIGAYVLAWLAGLVTPGAPAGVGVRELVLLALLGAVVEPPVLLMAIALGRMVTVSGDVLFFLSCAAMPAQRITQGAVNAE